MKFFLGHPVDRVRRLDRATLLANWGNRTTDKGREKGSTHCHILSLNNFGKVAKLLHSMLTNSEEHRKAFLEPALIAFGMKEGDVNLQISAAIAQHGIDA